MNPFMSIKIEDLPASRAEEPSPSRPRAAHILQPVRPSAFRASYIFLHTLNSSSSQSCIPLTRNGFAEGEVSACWAHQSDLRFSNSATVFFLVLFCGLELKDTSSFSEPFLTKSDRFILSPASAVNNILPHPFPATSIRPSSSSS